jgi:hypothetical protein
MVMGRLTNIVHATLDMGELIGFLIRGPGLSPSFNGEQALVGGDPEPNTNGHELPAPPVVPQPIEQWGLRLPNGNIVWENCLYQGLPIREPDQRQVLVNVLRRTAADLDFDEGTFLGHYGWARRFGIPAVQWGDITVHPLTIENSGSDTPRANGMLEGPGVSEIGSPNR